MTDGGEARRRPRRPERIAEPRPTGSSRQRAGRAAVSRGTARPGLYTSCHEVISYEVDHNVAVLPSKVVGRPPVIQQTTNPTCTVIQAGYLVREGGLDKRPAPPARLDPAEAATLKHWFVSPANPVPLAVVGQYRRTLSWRYVFALAYNLTNTGAVGAKYPDGVRVSVAPGRRTLTLPELVLVPSA